MQEEFEVFNEICKHRIAFHDLETDPEKKVKQLIKMWEFIKKDLNDDEDEREGFGELED